MVVDLLERSKVNIKDLGIPEPREPGILPFDPEKRLSSKDWERMEEELTSLEEDKRMYFHAFVQTFNMSLLSPARYPKIKLKPITWSSFIGELGEDKEKQDGFHLGMKGVMMKIISPYMFSKSYTRKDWEIMESGLKSLESSRRNNFGPGIVEILGFMKMILPNQAPSFNPDENSERYFGLSLKRATIDCEQEVYINSQFRLLSTAVMLPDGWGSADFKDLAEIAKKGLDKTRTEPIEQAAAAFSSCALILKILSAGGIDVTEQGLKFTQRISHSSYDNNPAMPKIRRF